MFRSVFVVMGAFPVLVWSQSMNYVATDGYSLRTLGQVAAPGQAVTLFVRGLDVPNAVANTVPLPRTLSGVTVVVTNPPTPNYPTTLPIFSVQSSPESCGGGDLYFCDMTAVTVQFPFEATCIPSSFPIPNGCTIGEQSPVKIAIQTSAGAGQEFWFSVVPQNPHFLNSCDTVFGIFGLSAICYPTATHADGNVLYTSAPARPGEVIVLYAVGLGSAQGAETGNASASPGPIGVDFYLSWGYFVDTPPGSRAQRPLVQSGQSIKADYAGLVKGFVGLYQVNVRLPDSLPQAIHKCQGGGDTNLRLLAGPTDLNGNYSASVDVCVQQQ